MRKDKTIKKIIVKWGDGMVYARAYFADKSTVDSKPFYTRSTNIGTRRTVLASLRRALRVVNLPAAKLDKAFARGAVIDEEVL